jgi:hypothetical protein
MLLLGICGCGTSGGDSQRVLIATDEGSGAEGPSCLHGSEQPLALTLACGNLYRFEDLRWNHWGAPVALAVGRTVGKPHQPGGATNFGPGPEKSFRVKVFAYRIEACPSGERRYTRLTWTFPEGTPEEIFKESHETFFGCGRHTFGP